MFVFEGPLEVELAVPLRGEAIFVPTSTGPVGSTVLVVESVAVLVEFDVAVEAPSELWAVETMIVDV